MRKGLGIAGFLLLAVSLYPLFLVARENIIDQRLNMKYDIQIIHQDEEFMEHIQTPDFDYKGFMIRFVEEPTGKKASLTEWDREEGVEAGDVVKLHMVVNGSEITDANEIWLSNRNRGGRYYSWMDVLEVNNRLAFVQRLTDDEVKLEKREWKIIWLDQEGRISEERVTYQKRHENPLAVLLINESGTSLKGLGYYSDIMKGIHTIFFPIFFPGATAIIGFVCCIVGLKGRRRRVKE